MKAPMQCILSCFLSPLNPPNLHPRSFFTASLFEKGTRPSASLRSRNYAGGTWALRLQGWCFALRKKSFGASAVRLVFCSKG